MLYNSFLFVFAFLPASLVAYYTLRRINGTWAIVALVVFSFVYYGYWNPKYLLLLIGSILGNYLAATLIARANARGRLRTAKGILVSGISANLLLLGYYKYLNFFLEITNTLAGSGLPYGEMVLPLAISFFTFQQITYLVDTHAGDVGKHSLLSYLLFVSFFPQLIAGPIVHHREMMSQFTGIDPKRRLQIEDLSVGLVIFVIGLAKKVLIADQMAHYANPLFAAATDATLDFYAAWAAALSYTFQLYFDFSGYSDMAVGVARMFGIRLPANFLSPYKATNIAEFWRHWHITLSRFLRDYLYIPLGDNRKGDGRRLANLLVTMLLGGLWHGAGWTFLAWGALHGFYLMAYQGWLRLRQQVSSNGGGSWLSRLAGRSLTFVAVVFGWVIFRSDNLSVAGELLGAMVGLEGLSIPQSLVAAGLVSLDTLAFLGVSVSSASARPMLFAALLLFFVWGLPNTYELMRDHKPVLLPNDSSLRSPRLLSFRPGIVWSLGVSTLLLASLINMLSTRQEFLYYEF